MDLADGLTHRPLSLADASAVTAVMAAQEKDDVGEVYIEEADIVGEWQRPSFDVASSTVGVFDGPGLVAYAEFSGGDRGDAAVHPDHRGRGIGTALAQWMQDRARAAGATVVGMPVPAGSPGEALLLGLGYRPRWTSWTLALPAGRDIAPRPIPHGYAVRAAHPGELEATQAVIEDAFLEWAARERQSFADFEAEVLRRPGFEPWTLRVALDPAGDVVGAAVLQLAGEPDVREGFVSRLAVRRDQRGRGLAQALLVDAFRQAREHGAVKSSLSTDSRTGALALYEKVGMVVTSTWVNLAIAL